MNQIIKDINMITLPFVLLLKDIADTGAELMHPDEFSRRNQSAYKTVLEGLRDYLFDGNQYMLNQYFEARDALQGLLDRAEELGSDRIKILTCSAAESYEVKQVQNDGRLGQAMYISSQLVELLNLIHPKNLDAL